MQKNERIKITIITVVLNDAKGLGNTIQSVISQTYNRYEYIVIDGGSTDGTLDVVNSHKNTIDYWISEPDNGIYNAMNKGIKQAHGEWIIFMNAGDTFANNHVLEKIKIYLNDTRYKVVYGKIMQIYEKRKELGDNIIKRKTPDVIDFVIRTIPHQAAFIKKDLFDKFGLYDEHYKLAADQIFFMQVIGYHREECKYVNEIVCNFLMNGSNVRHREICSQEKREAFERLYGDSYSFLRELAEYRNSFVLSGLLKLRIILRNAGIISLIRKILFTRF